MRPAPQNLEVLKRAAPQAIETWDTRSWHDLAELRRQNVLFLQRLLREFPEWRRHVRRYEEDPGVRIGVMLDVPAESPSFPEGVLIMFRHGNEMIISYIGMHWHTWNIEDGIAELRAVVDERLVLICERIGFLLWLVKWWNLCAPEKPRCRRWTTVAIRSWKGTFDRGPMPGPTPFV